MATKRDSAPADLKKLISLVPKKGAAGLETYLTEHSNLPGPRINLALVAEFADVIGEMLSGPDAPDEKLEKLLDSWAALSLEEAPVNDPREILPAMAVSAYGQAAISRPEWWDDEIVKLKRAASDPRWRVHEIVAMALQKMLDADWDRTFHALTEWLRSDDPLVIRAVAAAVAEPALLTDVTRGMNALAIQAEAIGWLLRIPAERRREEDMRTLRKALGFTLSVAVVAAPDTGLVLLNRLVAMSDPDIRWIVRENLKKSRLKPWAEQLESVQAALAG